MWDYFDRFYCISLIERSDRREEARAQFQRVGLYDRVEFVVVPKHPHNCEQGIYESHLMCIRKGLEAGAENMVIFEDDIVFERFKWENLARCVQFLKAHSKWDIFFLGCMMNSGVRTDFANIIKISYRCLSHAYVLNRPLAEKISGMPWRNLPYDMMLRTVVHESYAVSPAFAFQSASVTDNRRHLWLDRFRRWCGGLRRIQKANEWVCLHLRLILAMHAAAVLAAVGVIVWWI